MSARKQSAFDIAKNIRDDCKQPDAKARLMFTLATFCCAEGKCWPGNRELARAMRKSQRTIRRMIGELAKDGELEIVRHGGQKRGDRRVLRLTPYAHIHSPKKGDKVLAPLTDIKEDNAVAIKEDKSDTLRGTRYVG